MADTLMELLERLRSDLRVRHLIPSAILSADDDPGNPSPALIDLALRSAAAASSIDLSNLNQRLAQPPYYPGVWPGEHYKLLAGIVQVLNPKLVVEVGTATGLSALALKQCLAPSARVVTFDIVPWRQYPEAVLNDHDFADGRLQQFVGDLTNRAVAGQYKELLHAADFVFIDAAKDGRMEFELMESLTSVGLRDGALLMFDDIRFLEMLHVWRSLTFPKMDLTSFGHWSGTGLALWSQSKHWSGS